MNSYRNMNADSEEPSALDYACINAHKDIVELLLKDPRVVRIKGFHSPVQYACLYGHVKLLQRLLECQHTSVEEMDPYRNSVEFAVGHKHLEIVKLLLEDGRLDPSIHDNQAIRLAVRDGNFEMVELLLKDPWKRVDLSKDRNQCLEWACERGNPDIVELLLKEPVNPADFGGHSIILAVQRGHVNEIPMRNRVEIGGILLWGIMSRMYLICSAVLEEMNASMNIPTDITKLIQLKLMLLETFA